jgi:predicted nucleic acid-binding protein
MPNPQIDEGHFAALLDSPPMPQFSREAGLATMRNFCLNHLASHVCIVCPRHDGPLAVTEPIIMEVVAGARTTEREADLRRLLLRFTLLGFDAAADFDAAATIYRRCRHAGVTPRGMIDCLIASVALRNRATLLAADLDLSRVATIIGIELDDASRSS